MTFPAIKFNSSVLWYSTNWLMETINIPASCAAHLLATRGQFYSKHRNWMEDQILWHIQDCDACLGGCTVLYILSPRLRIVPWLISMLNLDFDICSLIGPVSVESSKKPLFSEPGLGFMNMSTPKIHIKKARRGFIGKADHEHYLISKSSSQWGSDRRSFFLVQQVQEYILDNTIFCRRASP